VKHRRGGVTAAQVHAFLAKYSFFELATSRHIDQKWIVSDTGFRREARALLK